ncbi:MAG TPA: ABC transporter ATP-binding protein [Candidatus Sulfotelmatobacter sp.]|nr:ABC transporter ATP-binding protein [Candidatus Sulfotelmatobacter sp.]
MAAEPLLAAEAIVSGYGKIEVLHGVSVRVAAGEVVSLIGPNGAGKSTVLKTILGYVTSSRGRVTFDGRDVTRLRADRLLRCGMAYVPQGRIVFPRMTVLENLELGAFVVKDRAAVRRAVEQVVALFPALAGRLRVLAGALSGGEQQMLAMGRALMTQPRCILMDEPSLGLSPKFVDLIFEKIVALRRAGITILMVEQNAVRALAISDRAYVLELGRNAREGTGRELLDDPAVRRMYLGG